MSDLVGNHTVGFPKRRLINVEKLAMIRKSYNQKSLFLWYETTAIFGCLPATLPVRLQTFNYSTNHSNSFNRNFGVYIGHLWLHTLVCVLCLRRYRIFIKADYINACRHKLVKHVWCQIVWKILKWDEDTVYHGFQSSYVPCFHLNRV